MASIDYRPAGPTVAKFHRKNTAHRVIEGPIGSGKSVGCCFEVYSRACEQQPNPDGVRRSRWAIIRNTYGELKTTTIKTWMDWFGNAGNLVWSAPPTYTCIRPLSDGTKLELEVLFLALDREEDAKKVLSLELTGAYLNEVREIRKANVDAVDDRLGRFPPIREGGPSWYGMICDSNMPDEDSWLYDMAEKERPKDWDFFFQPGGLVKDNDEWIENPQAENLENLPKGYYIKKLSGKTDDHIAVYYGAQYGYIAREGAYYADEIERATRDKRICNVPHERELPVHTAWDLGINDDMVVWFFQIVGREIHVIDYYENRQKALDHYVRYLKDWEKENDAIFGTHLWPHDGKAQELQTGRTREESFTSLMQASPLCLPRGSVMDGINGVRMLLHRCWFDKDRTRDGLAHLRRYRREWNKLRDCWKETPLHDQHSHGADAFRTLSDGYEMCGTAGWGDELPLPNVGVIA